MPPLAIHEPRWSGTEIRDATSINAYLEQAHGTRIRLSCSDDEARPPLRSTRVDIGPVVFETTAMPATVTLDPDPFGMVSVVLVVSGTLESHCEYRSVRAGAGDVVVPTQPFAPHHSTMIDPHTVSVHFDPRVLASLWLDIPVDHAPPLARLDRLVPINRAAAEQWKASVQYFRGTTLKPLSTHAPLVLGQAVRLLASVALAVFPPAFAGSQEDTSTEFRPSVIRRAVEFIESHVAEDVSVADVAAAAHVTKRTLQLAFRRHLDTTPFEYMQRCRLHYAHEDLKHAARGNDTVTAIAARWGFGHPGRFAVLYRANYGRSPHVTLRSSS